MYRLLVALVRLAVRSRRSKDLEIIVLRHQLIVRRRQVNRPVTTDADRSLLAAIAAALPRPSRAGWLVTPDTLLRWHRRRIARPRAFAHHERSARSTGPTPPRRSHESALAPARARTHGPSHEQQMTRLDVRPPAEVRRALSHPIGYIGCDGGRGVYRLRRET